MNLLLIPTLLSLLVLAAHFFRNDHIVLVFICCAATFLLVLRRAWATTLVQIILIIGALEWLRAAFEIRAIRIEEGRDWRRMMIILCSVAAFTALSALVYFIPPRFADITVSDSPLPLKPRNKLNKGLDVIEPGS